MKKKVSVGMMIIIAAFVGVVCFVSAYFIVTQNISGKVTDLNERRAMFGNLAEIDLAVRENYQGTINEKALSEALAQGYIKGVDETNIFLVSAQELADSSYEKDSGYKVVKLSDANALVFRTAALATVDEK